jgi:hypothetical protein
VNQNPTYPLDFFTADGSSMFDFFTGFTGAISHTATLTPIALVNATSVLGYKCFLCGTGSLSNKVRNPAESKPLCETRTPPLDFDAVRACFAGCCILSLVVAAFRVRAVCSSSLSTSLIVLHRIGTRWRRSLARRTTTPTTSMWTMMCFIRDPARIDSTWTSPSVPPSRTPGTITSELEGA